MVSRFVKSIVSLVIFIVCGIPVGNARANLIDPTVIANKPLRFHATVDITDLTPAAIALGGPDPDGDSGNWSAVIMQVARATDGDGIANDLLFELFHNIAPHPPLLEFAPNLVFSSEGGAGAIFANIVPGAPFPGLSGSNPHGILDLDTFRLTLPVLVAGTSSRLTVEMTHTPEPSGLTLALTMVTALAIAGNWYRRRLKIASGRG